MPARKPTVSRARRTTRSKPSRTTASRRIDILARAAVMLVWFKEKSHLTAEHQAHISSLEQQIGAMLNDFYAGGIASGDFSRRGAAAGAGGDLRNVFRVDALGRPAG